MGWWYPTSALMLVRLLSPWWLQESINGGSAKKDVALNVPRDVARGCKDAGVALH